MKSISNRNKPVKTLNEKSKRIDFPMSNFSNYQKLWISKTVAFVSSNRLAHEYYYFKGTRSYRYKELALSKLRTSAIGISKRRIRNHEIQKIKKAVKKRRPGIRECERS